MKTKEINKICNALIFEPLHCVGRGDQRQVARTKHKGVYIIQTTFIPWNIFKQTNVHYMIDLVLPIRSEPCLSTEYYTDEGFGVPVVKTLEEAILLIEKHVTNK